MLERAHFFIKRPRDLILALQIGLFILQVPSILKRRELNQFLQSLREPKRRAATLHSDMESIVRLRSPWLRLPMFGSHNTCYVRALTLFRFLDAPGKHVGIHFGIEQRDDRAERLRGHAWVTVDGEVVEGPQGEITGRLIEIPISPIRQ